MPIRFQYDAAAVVPQSSNELKKYGGQMLMQQRKYDLDQRNDQARISQLGAMRNYNAEPSRAEQMQFRDQAIRSGAFSPAMIKNIRDIEKEQGAVMRDKSLNAEQMADAMAQLDAQMRVAMSMGYPQQMVEARSQMPSGPRQPMTSAQAFAADPKLEEKFMGYVDPNNPDGSPKSYEQRLQEALAIRDAREKILFGQPQGQQQQGALPAGQPQGQMPPRQPVPPAGQPQASYSGVSPVMAQGGFQGMGQGAGQRFQPEYRDDLVYRGVLNNPPQVMPMAGQQAAPAQPATQTAPAAASQGGARKWTSNDGKYSTEGVMIGFRATQGGDPLTSEMVRIRKKDGVEVDVPLYRLSEEDRQMVMSSPQYDYQIRNQRIGGVNQQMFNRNSMEYSPTGSNYQQMFDPNNPEYAEMRAADQSIVNPQTRTLGQPGGRYGLGQIDYGTSPTTGNRVTASIRPGGTMPEYDEPVGKPGTAMGGRKGSVTIMGGKKKPAAEVSPGVSTPEQQAAYDALPEAQKAGRIDRSDPRVKSALKVAADPNATDDQKRAAAGTLDAAGFTAKEVLEATTKSAASPTTANQPASTASSSKSRESSERSPSADVQKAYEIIKGNRSHDRAGNKYPEFANAEKTLKAEGWTDQDISDLRRGKSKKKLPERPNPQQIADMQARLQSGNVSDAERQVIEDVLKAEGVSLDASPVSTPSQPATPSRSLTSPPGGELPDPLWTTTQSPLLSEQPEYEPPQLAETRIWTNVEGKKLEGIVVEGSIEAAANQPEGQRVITIKRSDGKFFNIPIDQLSEEDIAYIDAKYRMKNLPPSIVGEDGEDFFSRFKKGKAYKYEKPKQTDRKYNTGEKPGPRSKQYQDPGPFNDSIPAEFWNPKPPSEAYRQRMG
jgi:hypothetical protein